MRTIFVSKLDDTFYKYCSNETMIRVKF